MPEYILTITDPSWKKVRKAVEENLKEINKKNEAMKKKFRSLNKLLLKVNSMVDVDIEWRWKSGKVLHLTIQAVADLSNRAYNKQVAKLADFGKMRIERIRDEGNFVLVEG